MSEIHDLAAAHVLGSLEPDELAVYEAHLAGCASCQEEVAALEEGLVALAYADATPPPPHIREHVMEAIRDEPIKPVAEPEPRFARYVALAAAAALAVILATVALLAGDPIEDVLAAPDSVSVDLEVTDAYQGSLPSVARVVFASSLGAAAVEFSGLVPISDDLTYQLWLIDEAGPVSAGTFVPDLAGSALVLLDGEAAAGHVVGITVEPADGSVTPTGEVLFAAEI